ncbi:MAG: Na+/H+ antiporter NhaC family protein [Myxococcota bacterium]|nr:Na+/H+ antiporter NhaC family protein [Myxococcota bacterium]
MPQGVEPDWLSILPAAVTIVLAFATRQVILSLFAGIACGGLVLASRTGDWEDLNLISRFLLPAIGSASFAQILIIYLWCLGGLVGMWGATGGARHFAETVGGRIAKGPRSSLLFGWLVGVLFHQGGTVSTVLAGTTVKPVTDRYRVSHEELSYVVDSTASPIATLIPFNAWPLYIAGLVVGTIPLIQTESEAYAFFIRSIPYNFYALLAVLSTLLLALGWLPWTGRRMRRARERSRATGALDAPDAEPMWIAEAEPEADSGQVEDAYRPSLADFLIPIGALLSIAILPYLVAGTFRINEAFLAALLSAMIVARLRGMRLRRIMTAFVRGCQSMTIGAIVLALAVTLKEVAGALDTAGFVVTLVGGALSYVALPAILALICMTIAFSTGTSWGTYAVVFPIAMPLAYALNPDPVYISVCFGTVLGGAVFGDQCSPISDTTILSSMFTGCDLMDHVRTQLPLALAAALLGIAISTLIVLGA